MNVADEGPLASRLIHGDWWKEEDLPVRWEALLPGGALHVEVGFGDGEFLLAEASARPGERFVGLEHYPEGHRKLLKKARAQGLANVLSMIGDAYVLLNVAFTDHSLASITVNFPDPWPKARHARRRLFTEEFFRIAGRKLAQGGALRLATDDPAYARQATEELAKVPGLRARHPGSPWLTESPYASRTRYEKRWIEEGRPLHYMLYEREGAACPT